MPQVALEDASILYSLCSFIGNSDMANMTIAQYFWARTLEASCIGASGSGSGVRADSISSGAAMGMSGSSCIGVDDGGSSGVTSGSCSALGSRSGGAGAGEEVDEDDEEIWWVWEGKIVGFTGW